MPRKSPTLLRQGGCRCTYQAGAHPYLDGWPHEHNKTTCRPKSRSYEEVVFGPVLLSREQAAIVRWLEAQPFRPLPGKPLDLEGGS